MSVLTVLRGERLELLPGQRERRIDLAVDLEVPGREVRAAGRSRSGGPGTCRSCTGRAGCARRWRGPAGRTRRGVRTSCAASSSAWVAADIVAHSADDGPVTDGRPIAVAVPFGPVGRDLPPRLLPTARRHRHARLQRGADARADVRGHPARAGRPDHPRRRRVARRDGRHRPPARPRRDHPPARTGATAATRRPATTRPSRPAPTSS